MKSLEKLDALISSMALMRTLATEAHDEMCVDLQALPEVDEATGCRCASEFLDKLIDTVEALGTTIDLYGSRASSLRGRIVQHQAQAALIAPGSVIDLSAVIERYRVATVTPEDLDKQQENAAVPGKTHPRDKGHLN